MPGACKNALADKVLQTPKFRGPKVYIKTGFANQFCAGILADPLVL
jgi:hypothetical protein